jgi:hypothetical protein
VHLVLRRYFVTMPRNNAADIWQPLLRLPAIFPIWGKNAIGMMG